jgi:hypothetical protein
LSNFDCRSSKSHVDGVDKLNKKWQNKLTPIDTNRKRSIWRNEARSIVVMKKHEIL